MPELKFYCVLCGTSITGNETFYGSEFSCPACNARVAIPHPHSPADTTAPCSSAAATPSSRIEPAAPSPLKEQPLARFSPVLRAFLGRLFLAALLVGCAIASLVMLWPYEPWSYYSSGFFCVAALLLFLATLWKCKSLSYTLTTQRIIITSGLLSKHVDELELFRVKDILVVQSFWQRMLNYGSIIILSTDDTTPQLTVAKIRAPLAAKELIRDAYREARRVAGLRATEFIQS